jgi:hypothetical protein
MARINELIEWDDFGTSYSLYTKHFSDDEGHVGLKMIFEDITHQKVTEIVIPPRKLPSFLRSVNFQPRSSII